MLPESATARRRSPAGIGLSLIAHAAAILLAANAGGAEGADSNPPPPRVATIHFPPPPVPSPIDGRRGPGGGDPSAPPAPGPVLPAAPPTVPVELPPIDPLGPVIDETTPWAGDEAARRLSSPGEPGDGTTGGGAGGPMAFADRGALPLPGNPRPRYPERLRTAGIEGRVAIEAVIDTAGTIEPASIRVVRADHPLFEDAVRAVLPLLRFAPAEVEGRPVRTRVIVPFEFRIEGRGWR